ncbi:MAG: hypothetical protein ACSHYF_04650 [Verrucomicrobiaceae bacterium]
MNKLLWAFGFLFVLLVPCFGGGNSSVVELDKVTSITIEEERVVIVGSGMLHKRIMSDAEHGDASAFGQPAQMVYAKVVDCTFEVVPYSSRRDVSGVPGADPDRLTEEQKARIKKWWEGTLADAREIQVGDAVTIGYQEEKMTITGVWVTHIVGAGSVKVRKKELKK